MKRILTVAAGVCLTAGFAVAQNGISEIERGVPFANPRVGHPATVVAPKLP